MRENQEIRKRIRDARLNHRDVANEIGIAPPTLACWLSKPLSDEHRSRIEQAIERIGDRASTITSMKVVYDKDALPLLHAHPDDAGYDLCIPTDATLPARGSLIINTGVHCAIPRGYVGMLKSKSGLNVKHGIRGEGTIDSGYTGEIVVKLYSDGDSDYHFKRGDKIIQLVLMKIATPDIEVVSDLATTERGTGGFGSTGR